MQNQQILFLWSKVITDGHIKKGLKMCVYVTYQYQLILYAPFFIKKYMLIMKIITKTVQYTLVHVKLNHNITTKLSGSASMNHYRAHIKIGL